MGRKLHKRCPGEIVASIISCIRVIKVIYRIKLVINSSQDVKRALSIYHYISNFCEFHIKSKGVILVANRPTLTVTCWTVSFANPRVFVIASIACQTSSKGESSASITRRRTEKFAFFSSYVPVVT